MVATSAPTAPPSASANLSSLAFSEGGGYGGQVAVNAEKEERAAKSFSPRFSPTSRSFAVHHSVRKLSTSPHRASLKNWPVDTPSGTAMVSETDPSP
jgi:hypothetical protein